MQNDRLSSLDPALDVDRLFADAIARSGGIPTSDLVGTSPAFKNADFVVPDKRIVVELKRLTIDRRDAIIEKVSAEYEKFRRGELVPKLPQPMNWVSMSGWPAELRRFVHNQLTKRLNSVVKAANQQIKQTQAHFGWDESRGLLVLFNERDSAFQPGLVPHLLAHTFDDRNRSINTVLFASANLPVYVEGLPDADFLWQPIGITESRGYVRPSVDPIWLEQLWDCWRDTVQQDTGRPCEIVDVGGNATDRNRIRLFDHRAREVPK